jgi:hypothetical protein
MSFIDVPFLDVTPHSGHMTTFGICHFKKPLPFEFGPGDVIKFFPTNFNATILVLTESVETEHIFENSRHEFDINIKFPSVIFVNCNQEYKYGRIQYQIDGNPVKLSQYTFNDSINLDNLTTNFVFIEGDQIQLFAPKSYFKYIQNLPILNQSYNDLINCFDELINFSVPRKIFIKYDNIIRGNDYFIAYPNIKVFLELPFILDCIYEIANLYTSDEIWIGVLCDYYQYHTMSIKEYEQKSWLGQSQNNCEKLIETKIPYCEWNVRDKTLFLTKILYKIGHRSLLSYLFLKNNKPDFNDLTLACRHFGLNIVPILKLAQISLDHFLCQLLKYDIQQIPYININSVSEEKYILAINYDIPTDLLGCRFSIGDFSSIFLKTKKSENIVFQPGCYKITSESGNGKIRYRTKHDYLFINKEIKTFTLSLINYRYSYLLNETFSFFDRNGIKMARLIVDFYNEKIDLEIFKKKLFISNDERIYFSIFIKNKLNVKIKCDDIISLKVSLPLKLKEKIKIFHRDPQYVESSFDFQQNQNIFTVTEMGLITKENRHIIYDKIYFRVKKFISVIKNDYSFMMTSPFVRDTLYLLVQYYPEIKIDPFLLPNTKTTKFLIENILHIEILHDNRLLIEIKNKQVPVRFFVKNRNRLMYDLNINQPLYIDYDDDYVLVEGDVVNFDNPNNYPLLAIINGQVEKNVYSYYLFDGEKLIPAVSTEDKDKEFDIAKIASIISIIVILILTLVIIIRQITYMPFVEREVFPTL